MQVRLRGEAGYQRFHIVATDLRHVVHRDSHSILRYVSLLRVLRPRHIALALLKFWRPLLQSDLTVLEDSINTQNPSPLQNEIIAIQLKWSNQATAGTGQYKILLEDLNESETILERDMSNLESGSIISLPLTHSFETTGTHVLRLTLDYLSEVDELTDENNIFEYSIEVTQIGVCLLYTYPRPRDRG